ncbi:MAG: metal ABC transporter permease [Magnetospiraceae bacterium]
MDDFLLRALAAGLVIALAAAPLGCFMVWRRMAYFGDTLAHSALLGVALGAIAGLAPLAGVLVVSLAVASLLAVLQRRRLLPLAADTLLGILSHGALALGLVAVSVSGGGQGDLMGYLFGDILAVSADDLVILSLGGACLLGVVALLWRPLLSITASEDLARVDGVPVGLVRFLFMALVAVAVAGAMKAVGVLLVTALLIIPAATARPLSRSPEGMALRGALVGMASVIGGLGASFLIDVPTGPMIVVMSLIAFVIVDFMPRKSR